MLQELQKEFHYLPEEALREVCSLTEITPAQITGVSTFYSQFRHEPAGRNIIRICTGTACHVKGALFVYEAFRRKLNLTEGKDTDPSGAFTIEKVACLGCCTLAPVVKIDSVTYGHVSPDRVGDILMDFQSRRSDKILRTSAPHHPFRVQGEIRIGLGSCCIASGSADVKIELEKVLASTGVDIHVKQVGCVGICNQVPVLEIIKPNHEPSYYTHVRPEEVRPVVLDHFKPKGLMSYLKTKTISLANNMLTDEIYLLTRYDADQRNTPIAAFLGPQTLIATEHRGALNPTDINEYRRSGGFEALRHCLSTMTHQQVIDRITDSGLRGRGGAGFPTGKKWQLVRDEIGDKKYMICNGDEGDPGAFMDRMLLESYPYRILEGMMIAGYATGISDGILYIRAEYPLAVERIRHAIHICKEQGLPGTLFPERAFTFDLRVFEGAGAFVCGEETALIASIEGRRGNPDFRPPYPSTRGLFRKPTLINNTETFALVSQIMRRNNSYFSSIGTQGSRGTKVFALAGKVRWGGLIEVPMGISIRHIVEQIGGGISGGKGFKGIQIGGPSGGCLPASLADLPIDFEALAEAGSMMGSGGLIVLDDSDCMVDIARYFLAFTQQQSCGRCTFCRIGTRRMLEMLDKIRSGNGTPEDIVKLEQLAHSITKTSLCGLGRTAPNPVLSTLRYFRDEYDAHVQGRCPAGKCIPLIRYHITESCNGCTLCAQKCPSGAIAFKPY